MLDAPEAAGCYGAFLRAGGDGGGRRCGRVEVHCCGGEGAGKALEECGHVEGHEKGAG